MPTTGFLDVRCQQALEEIITISQRIRYSALRCANNQDTRYLNNIEILHQQLGIIRGCADTIQEIITLQNRTVDERIITWLFNGGLPPCLDKLKELDDMFKLDGQPQPTPAPTLPLNPAVNNIAKAIAFLEKHKDMFYFLLTPEVWDHEKHPQQSQQLPQSDTHLNAEETPQAVQEIMVRSSTERDRRHGENLSQSRVDQEATGQRTFLNQKLEEVSRWLAAIDCTDKHNEMLKQRQQGTCMWFPGVGAFKRGNPVVVRSCGYTAEVVVESRSLCECNYCYYHIDFHLGSASTIEHLKSTLEDGDVLAYYYCDFRNEKSTSPTEVMRSLLSQLFRHFRDCSVEAGALPNRILEEKSDGTLTLNDLDQMTHLVLRAAGRFPRPPMMLIDALDECVEVEKLLPALTMLIHPDIRLLVTSRPLEVFKDHFGKYPSLSFHAMGKELAADIGSHITQELYSHPQLRSADPKLKLQVRGKLQEKTDGRFRWVQCQLDTLRRCSSRQELQDVLDNLPGELETTYERILSKIDERTPEAKLIRRTLVWLMVALVPLRLTQLLDGLSFDPREQRIQHGTQLLGPALLDALSSLVSFNEETDVLALSHLTVKEYLTSRTALPMYHIIPHEAHIEVTEMCMFYVTCLLKQVRFRAGLAVSESSPMLSYVFSTGLNHLAYVDPASSIALDVLQSFASEVNRHPSHWDLLCEMREEDSRMFYPPWPSSRHDVVLYTLIAYSPVCLLESFLSRNRPLKPRPGTSPLVYAADLWKTTHAITLLRSNVDATVPGLVVDDSRHALPLEIAIDLGNDILVGELLQRGSVVTSELLSTAVCMPWCSTRVLVKLVETDAFTEWAHEIGDEELYHAIFSSARPNAGDSRRADRDHVALAQRLRDLDQNLAPNDSFGAELVERALHAGHISMLEFLLPPDQPPPSRFLISACTGNTSETTSVVRFLLDKKVNTHIVTRVCGDTPLHLAAMSPWEPRALELTKILLDAGCNPSARNRRRETPLITAVRRGYPTVVEHLLSRKALLPSYILLLALQRRWKPQTIKLLLRAGANINARTVSGNMGIHLAVMDLEEVRYEDLQDKEPIVEQVACEEWEHREHTISQPEHDDSEHEEYEVVDNGDEEEDWSEDEDDEAEGGIYGPCEEYEEAEWLEVVKILIEAGCDPTSRDADGRTVLEIAIEQSYTSVVEYLLSYGVLIPQDILLTVLRYHPIGGLKVVELLVRKGANVHSTTADGDTVLHLAVIHYNETHCINLIKIFVEAGCDPNSYGGQHRTVLEVAIQRSYTSVVEHLLSYGIPIPQDILLTVLRRHPIGGLKVVELLVRKGANVHSTTADGDTVLHLAVIHYKETHCINLIKIFVEAGCDPNSYGGQHRTVLEVAIQRSDASVVEHLLSCGVSFPQDILPIVLRCHPVCNLKVVELLVRKGANVHSTTADGNTVLHLAVIHYKETHCINLIKIFVEAGFDPNSYGGQHRTVLEVAIQRSDASVVEHLLSCGVSFPQDILPIVLRCRPVCNLKVVELLVRKGANVHSTTADGDTVLHLAVIHYKETHCINLIKIFVEAGCDPNSYGAKHRTVLEVAILHGCISVVEYLLSCGVLFPLNILPAILQRRLTQTRAQEIVKLLIHKGADVHSTATNGDTVLHLAVIHYGSLDLIKIFVEAGCDPTSYGAQHRTVLEVAVEANCTPVVEYLLSHGVPLPPDILLTSLSLQPDMIINSKIPALLVSHGADVHWKTSASNSDTILHIILTKYRHSEPACLAFLKALIQGGCDPKSRGARGLTVLEIAAECGHAAVVGYLLLLCGVPFSPAGVLSTALQHPPFALQVIECLVTQGADICFTTSGGETAFNLVMTLLMRYYTPVTSLKMISFFIDGYNPVPFSSIWIKILETAIHWRYTSLVDLLLPHGIQFPPNILSTALQDHWDAQLVEILARKGADVHSISDTGETVFHLAITEYIEPVCLRLVKAFIVAGCVPTRCNSDGLSVLEAAIKDGYTHVVELLLSHNVPLSPHILFTALQPHTTPEMVELLVRHGADVHITTADGDDLLQIPQASYDESDKHRRITEILENARGVKRNNTDSGDVTHVAKRPRLE